MKFISVPGISRIQGSRRDKIVRHWLVTAALVLGSSGAAQAATDCTLKTPRGLYVFSASGFNLSNGAFQPKAIID